MRKIILAPFILLEILVMIGLYVSFKFPECDLYADNKGSWITTPDHSPNKSDIRYLELVEHFIGDSGPGEALFFDQLWIPHSCSYHRFTNHSLHKCIKYLLKEKLETGSMESHLEQKEIKIVFLGDSSMRGIFCGISRVFAGSEVYGPCESDACERLNNVGIGSSVEFFGGLLKMAFTNQRTNLTLS